MTNSKKRSFTRRDFIKGAAAGSSLILAGCSSLDSLFTESRRFFEDEVIIVGAGLAGLAAAYHLKKNKVPYRLFEASERVGGRVFSLAGYGGEGRWGELGAEFVSSDHTSVLTLARELGFKPALFNGKAGGEDFYFFGGKRFVTSDLQRAVPSMVKALYDLQVEVFQGQKFLINSSNAARYPKLGDLDNQPVSELLEKLKKRTDERLLQVLRRQLEVKWGASAEQMSALHFIEEPYFSGQGTFVLPGGWSQVTQTLYDRVSGGVPEFLVRDQHQLVSISRGQLGMELNFKTPDGRRSYFAKRVILALPMGALAQVQGLSEGLSEQQQQFLYAAKIGSLEKGLLQNKDLILGSSRYAISDGSWGAMWAQGEERKPANPMESPVITFQRPAISNVSSLEIDEEFKKQFKISTSSQWGPLMRWGQKKGMSSGPQYFAPGEFAKWNGLFNEAVQGDRSLRFAGEYCEYHNKGTMEAAVRSAQRVAEGFVQKKS